MNKKILIVSVLSLIILSIFISLLLIKKKEVKPEEAIVTLSENFTRDFATYKQKEAIAYQEKLKIHLSNSYYNEFIPKYSIYPITEFNSNEINDYSKYISSEIKIIKSDPRKESFTVLITYKALVRNINISKTEFERENTIKIQIKKEGKDYKITGFNFTEK